MGDAVGFLTVPTRRAGLRRVGRIDNLHGDACEATLVGDVAAKLVKGPTAHPHSLRPTKPCPLADAGEVLQCNSAPGAFGLRNESLADNVVHITPKTGLLVLRALQSTSDAPGSLATLLPDTRGFLERAPTLIVAGADLLDSFATKGVAVARGRKVLDAEIDADEICRGNRRTVRHIHRHKEEPLTVVPKHEVALTLLQREPLLLVAAHEQRDRDAAFESEHRCPVQTSKREGAGIVGNRRVLAKRGLHVPVSLVRLDNAMNAEDRHLGGQPKPFSDFVVEQFLRFDLVGNAMRVQFTRNPVGGFVKPLNRSAQFRGLSRVRKQLELQGDLHRSILE